MSTDYWEKQRAEEQQRLTWLAGLKAGDEVAVCHTGSVHGPHYDFLKVEKRTATQIVAGYRYRAQDGSRTGDRYGARLVEPTVELKQEVADKTEHRELTNRLDRTKWREVARDGIVAASGCRCGD